MAIVGDGKVRPRNPPDVLCLILQVFPEYGVGMKHLRYCVTGALALAAAGAGAQPTDARTTESPVQPSSQGPARSTGPGLAVTPGVPPGTNATGASGSSETITPDGNKALGTTIRGSSDSASTSDHRTSRTWGGVGSTGGATGTGTSSGTSDAPSEAAAGVTPSRSDGPSR